jgi:biopolymer transport protein ExbB
MEAEGYMSTIGYLSIISTLAPMMGLLGTVMGMIQLFMGISASGGLKDPQVLALGIYKALVTTAAGLTVAIPMMGFYFYLRGRGVKMVMKIETITNALIKKLKGRDLVGEEGAEDEEDEEDDIVDVEGE